MARLLPHSTGTAWRRRPVMAMDGVRHGAGQGNQQRAQEEPRGCEARWSRLWARAVAVRLARLLPWRMGEQRGRAGAAAEELCGFDVDSSEAQRLRWWGGQSELGVSSRLKQKKERGKVKRPPEDNGDKKGRGKAGGVAFARCVVSHATASRERRQREGWQLSLLRDSAAWQNQSETGMIGEDRSRQGPSQGDMKDRRV